MSTEYSLSVTLSARITTADAEIERQMKMRIQNEQVETYIQTDKPKYSAGQEVKFRMLSIKSPSLKVVKNNIPSIWIEAPNDIRVRQWVDVKADEGLVDLQMLLSDEPILGTWTIKAMIADKTVTQTFVVEEYVLPKFEILIDTPSSIYVRDETFKVKVCGIYTYGQPVRGSVNVTICFRHSYDDCNPETTVVKYAKDTGSDGCGEFELTSEELKWDRTNYYYYYESQQLSANVNFTEAGTDITLTSSSLSTTVKTTAVQIEITGLSYYKPGIEYNGKVFIKNVDGSPANGINTTIHIQEKRESDVIHIFNSFSNKGVVTFRFDAPIDTAIASLLITVTAEGYQTQTYDEFYGYYRIRNNPSNKKTISAFYSPSGSFLNIKPVPNEINFGGVYTFDVDYTIPTGDSKTINLHYMVIARSAVAKFGSLAVETPSCSREEKRETPWSEYSDYYITGSEDELVVGLEPLPPTCQFSFKLSIDITSKMSPDAKLLIHYAREDGEIVADSIELKIVRGLPNEVILEFEEDMTRPGDKTTLLVQAAANSLCAVGIVDKSVQLLGTTNQLTDDRVFTSLTPYSFGVFNYPLNKCRRSLFENEQQHDIPPPKKERRYSNTYVKTKHMDSATVFMNAGVAFTTSLDVETRPCYEITEYQVGSGDMLSYNHKIVDEMIYEEIADDEIAEDEEDISYLFVAETKEEPPVKIRTYFPETLLWQIKRTREEDGTAKFDLKVPDTITDWKANGFCISPNSDIGIGETTTLRAFKPFFVSLTLPYSVIRNESVPLKVTVFNYLADQCLMVKLELKESSNFTTLGNDFTRKVCVCGGGSKTVQYRIVPHTLGNVPITVSAVTKGFSKALGRRMCDGEPDRPDKQYIGLTDGVQRDLLVEPEGIERDETQSSIICLSSNEKKEKASYKVNFPENIVPGSDRVTLQLIGDIMGPALNNMNHLIRLPTGCGEQNIVKMAPNVYVLKYLINTGQIEARLKQTIVNNIRAGYQRELNYRRRDGSYSAFGQSDYDGSTWLTVFVLRTFAESDEFIEIDSNLMRESLSWLINQQNKKTGCIMSRGTLFNKAMKGGVSDEITLTAYTLITMTEAVGRKLNRGIDLASKCLVNRWDDVDSGIRNDPYSVALLAYAFKLSKNVRYHEVLSQLNELAIEENGLKHWERPEGLRPKNTCYYCRASSAEVEMTAYALLALDLEVGADQIEALKISKWLIKQQNANGGYSSTQDTVIALKGLSYFSEALYTGETTQMSITATSSAGGETETFELDSSNRLLLQRMDIEKAPTTVDIEASGTGCALIQVQTLYNIYEKPEVEVEPFSISVESIPDEKLGCQKQTVRITVSYTGEDQVSSMSIVEVKLVSGYYVDKDSLKSQDTLSISQEAVLIKTLGFKRYEANGNMLEFYFDEFTSEPISFEFDVVQELKVKNSKPGIVTVYDYYEAELKSVKSYKFCR
ncbi:pregnancy zone protein-like [Antedon mediterranea]|uniref:pregnancy zone protein-like n=1 Tax=Antedon mediterranea TaxID=105859 RepID=UPI003AF41DC7